MAAQHQIVRLVDHRYPEIGREPDDDHIENCANARHLALRYPDQQDDSTDDDDDLSKRQGKVSCQPLMEHVPRIQAEGRLDHHRHREAVQEQPGDQSQEPFGHACHRVHSFALVDGHARDLHRPPLTDQRAAWPST